MRRHALLSVLLAACCSVAFLISACGDHRPASITKPLAEGGVAKEKPAKDGKVLICHEDENGERSIISINENAWPAHERHGDAKVVDADGDGYVAGENFCVPGGDCNDNDATIHPGAQEQCDGVDGNCNGNQDESGEPIGTNSADIKLGFTRRVESEMGNLVADAMRAYYVDADAAMINSSSLRDDLLFQSSLNDEGPGLILCIELFAILPFGNKAVLVTLTGAQLKAFFEQGFAGACNVSASADGFPHISGLRVEYVCNGLTSSVVGMWKTPNGMGGAHTPILPTDTIRLVMSDFTFGGGNGYTVPQQGTAIVQTNDTLLKTLTEYVMSHPGLASAVEGRVVRVVP